MLHVKKPKGRGFPSMLETVVCVALLFAREIPELTVPYNSVSRRQGVETSSLWMFFLSWKK